MVNHGFLYFARSYSRALLPIAVRSSRLSGPVRPWTHTVPFLFNIPARIRERLRISFLANFAVTDAEITRFSSGADISYLLGTTPATNSDDFFLPALYRVAQVFHRAFFSEVDIAHA